jgi:hypothetical protein
MAQPKCGFCGHVGEPVAQLSAQPTAGVVVLLLCNACNAVLAAAPQIPQFTQ